MREWGNGGEGKLEKLDAGCWMLNSEFWRTLNPKL